MQLKLEKAPVMVMWNENAENKEASFTTNLKNLSREALILLWGGGCEIPRALPCLHGVQTKIPSWSWKGEGRAVIVKYVGASP